MNKHILKYGIIILIFLVCNITPAYAVKLQKADIKENYEENSSLNIIYEQSEILKQVTEDLKVYADEFKYST